MEQFAKIYLDTALSFEDVLEAVQKLTGGARSVRTVTAEPVEIDVLRNEDHDPARAAAGDFVYFPYIVEVYPAGDLDDARFVGVVRTLVERAAGEGWRFATAADFDEQLPGTGRND
jgi:hypothetical protein